MFAGSIFYNDMLLPCASDNEPIAWSKLPHPDFPVAVFHHGGVESWVDEGSVSPPFTARAFLLAW